MYVSARDNENELLSCHAYDITASRPIMWGGGGKLRDRCSSGPTQSDPQPTTRHRSMTVVPWSHREIAGLGINDVLVPS